MNFFTQQRTPIPILPRSVGRSPEYHIHPLPPPLSYLLYLLCRPFRLPSVPLVPHTLPPPSSSLLSLSLSVVGCWLSSSSVVYILFAHLCIFISHLPHYPDLTAWPCHRPLNPVLISLMSSLSLITHSFCLVFFFPFLFLFLVFLHFSFFLFLFFT